MTTHLLRSMPALTASPEPEGHPLRRAMLEERVKQTTDGPGYQWAGDIRRLLCPWLTSHRCSVDDMADLLAMNRRTFDRRLKSRGTSSRALANEIRFEVACRLLTETAMSLSQIAAALGYSQASAFTRAFRGWSGQAPNVWRAAH
jgi:AraC-like DNA-binding protein